MARRRIEGEFLVLPALHADPLAAHHGMSLVLQGRGHTRFLQMVPYVRRRNLQGIGNLPLRRAGIPHLAYFFAQFFNRMFTAAAFGGSHSERMLLNGRVRSSFRHGFPWLPAKALDAGSLPSILALILESLA